jgi:hypothetical protein
MLSSRASECELRHAVMLTAFTQLDALSLHRRK